MGDPGIFDDIKVGNILKNFVIRVKKIAGNRSVIEITCKELKDMKPIRFDRDSFDKEYKKYLRRSKWN